MERTETNGAIPTDFPADGVELRYVLVVTDYARSLKFYRDVLGATVVHELPGILGVLNFRGSQLLLSARRGPASDRPSGRPSIMCELTIRVPRCLAAYEALRSRGAEFVTPPFVWGNAVRALFHDPDGHLLEIAETQQV